MRTTWIRPGSQHRLAGRVQVTGDLDAESVLLQRRDGLLQDALIGQRGEAAGDGSRAHGWSSLMPVTREPEPPPSRLAR